MGEAIRMHNDWKDGHHPVALGWCAWLPRGYQQVVNIVSDEVLKQNEAARERAKARSAKRG